MAELTKIFTGMEKGPEEIDKNFKEINGRTQSVRFDLSETDIDPSANEGTVKELAGHLIRVGNRVDLSLKVVLNSPEGSNQPLGIFNIPDGYKPSTQIYEYALAIVSNTDSMPAYSRAIAISNSPASVQARCNNGIVYVTGSWITDDDFPTE